MRLLEWLGYGRKVSWRQLPADDAMNLNTLKRKINQSSSDLDKMAAMGEFVSRCGQLEKMHYLLGEYDSTYRVYKSQLISQGRSTPQMSALKRGKG